MAVQLTDGTTANVVDPISAGILVQNPKVAAQAGFAGMVAIRDPGTVTGVVNAKAADITNNSRLRVALDTPVLQEDANYSAQNTSKWSFAAASQTLVLGSGYASINAGSDVTSGHYGVYKTWRTFPLYTAGEVLVDIRAYLTQAPQANSTIYFGLGLPGTTAAPTDGCYFQFDATGALKGVINYNGTSTTTAALTVPSTNTIHEWLIYIDDSLAEFWIDGVLQGVLSIPGGQGTPSFNGAAQLFFQNTNTGTVALAQQIHFFNAQVSLLGLNTSKPWPHIKAGEGLVGYQGQDGGTMGTTANLGNGAMPAATVLVDTAVGTGNPVGLGGTSHNTATLAAGGDGIVTSYQNPVGSITQTPRVLYICGVWVHTMVDATLTGGPLAFVYSLAFGHTAVSLATAESASGKAPRRIWLGAEGCPATSAAGTLLSPQGVYRQFATPVPVNPGEFVAVVARNMGTVASGGSVIHTVGFDAYFE